MSSANPDDTAQLRRLIHELSEALTATNSYLYASHRLMIPGDFHSLAISKAIEQASRAGEVVSQLRAAVERLDTA